jgi:hypothetical protein
MSINSFALGPGAGSTAPGANRHTATHYSEPAIGALIEALEKICALRFRKSPALAIVRARAEPSD